MRFIQEERYKNEMGIYQIRNLIDGKVYIGQTQERFMRRYWHHRWKLNDGSHDNLLLQTAWDTDGEDQFVFEVLEVVEDKSTLDVLEMAHIKEAKVGGLAYNMADGGGGKKGVPMSSRAKEIVGAKNRQHMTGKKLSAETRAKMSASSRSRETAQHRSNTVLTPELARTIKELLMEGNSCKKIAQTLGVSEHAVNGILSGDAWRTVNVEGWADFQTNRKRITKLSMQDAEQIRKLYAAGLNVQQIAGMYGKCRHTIANILRGKTHRVA